MKPEDFDINFDFDKEYGMDPNANKSSFDDDFDLEERPRASRASTAPRQAPRSSSYDDVLEDLSAPAASTRTAAPVRTGGSKVVNISTQTQMQVVLVKPDRFDNVSEIAEHLRSKHAVVLNLEATNKETV